MFFTMTRWQSSLRAHFSKILVNRRPSSSNPNIENPTAMITFNSAPRRMRISRTNFLRKFLASESQTCWRSSGRCRVSRGKQARPFCFALETTRACSTFPFAGPKNTIRGPGWNKSSRKAQRYLTPTKKATNTHLAPKERGHKPTGSSPLGPRLSSQMPRHTRPKMPPNVSQRLHRPAPPPASGEGLRSQPGS